MKKLYIFSIFFLFICIFVLGQNTNAPKLIILPFQIQGELPGTLGETVTDLTANRLNTSKYYILDRSALDKNIQQKVLIESLTVDNVELLKSLNIELVMFGQIAKVSDKYYGGYRIVEVATARVAISDSIKANTFDEFLEGIYQSLAAKGFHQTKENKIENKDDKEYILVKREQWEMLNKFVKQTKTPTPNLDKQAENYLATWQQSIIQNRSYGPILKAMKNSSRDLDDVIEESSEQEIPRLRALQAQLDATMEKIKEIQKLDAQSYEKIATAVSQNNLRLVTSLIGQYCNETTHFKIMTESLAKLSYQLAISVWVNPSSGYKDTGAGPDPQIKLQVFSFYPKHRYFPAEWKQIGNGLFEKNDIVGDVELGYVTINFDFEHNYAIRIQLFERNLLKNESLGDTEIDISSLVQSGIDQAVYWTKKTPYGEMTIKILTKRITFPNPLPKFHE